MRTRASHLLLTALFLTPAVVAAQEAAPQLNDAEIAHVAVTANAIDAHFAQLAAEHASQADVVAFARRMSSDHTGVNERAAALAGRLGVTPAENDVSRSLHSHAQEVMASLEDLRGAAFDRAYMEREVAYHQAVLDALDGLLIPSTENAELKALLEEVRPVIASHLEHAGHILAQLPVAP